MNRRLLEVAFGLMFIILGIMIWNRPIGTIGIVVALLGWVAIIRGISTLFVRSGINASASNKFRILLGIFDIIIGIILVSNVVKGALFLGIMFSLWFLIDSVSNLFLIVRFDKTKGIKKVTILLFDIFCLIFSILLLLNPLLSVLAIPILIALSSIMFGLALISQGVITKGIKNDK